MTAKDYLNQARTVDRERKVKETELRKLRADAQTLRSPQWGERVKTSPQNISMAICDKVADMETEIETEIDYLLDLKSEIRGKIGQLQRAEYRILLTDYYVNCKRWEQVAEDNGYSDRQMRRLHKNAINAFEKKFFVSCPQMSDDVL